MANRNYNSGRRFEYRVKKFLEQKGYYVMRSAGSKSPFDLIAVPVKQNNIGASILLIQCKHGSKINKKEKDGIILLDATFSDMVYSIIAWSKMHGQIEFEIYDYAEREWVEVGWL